MHRSHSVSRRPVARRRRGERGFTLLELMVSLFLAVMVIVAGLQLLDKTNLVGASQIARTDMQQSLRAGSTDMVRKIRHAGRGGLRAGFPGDLLENGKAVAVRNNVTGATEDILIGDGSSPTVLANTDVLIVRGSFDSPVWYVNATDDTTTRMDDEWGEVDLTNRTPKGDILQDLEVLGELISPTDASNPIPGTVLLVSAGNPDLYGVAQIDTGNSVVVRDPMTQEVTSVMLRFQFDGTATAQQMAALSTDGIFPDDDLDKANIVSVAVLDEYRYYVRQEYQVPGDATTPLAPRLSRAQVYAGTETAYAGNAANLRQDLADGILDLQVALGFDSDIGGLADGQVTESTDGTPDDWLLNDDGDDLADAKVIAMLQPETSPLYYVRITALGRSTTRDRAFLSPSIQSIEDRDYVLDGGNANDPDQRRYRRDVLTTVVEMRNL